MAAVGACADCRDCIDRVHAVDGFAEHAITKTSLRLIAEVQEIIVGQIDEELTTG